MQDQNELSGILFKNDRKERDNQPDYKGSTTVKGVAYWISGWKKQGQNGTFLSLALTEKDQPAQEQGESRPAPPDDF